MTRGYSSLKVTRRIAELSASGKEFTLVDEAKKLGITSKEMLSFIRKEHGDVERIPAPKQNCMWGNYARYQITKGVSP